MKVIDVLYNEFGEAFSVTDNSVHFEQENNSLKINATIETEKSVRAYISAPNGNSLVTDTIEPLENVYSVAIEDTYMSKGTLYAGFEIFDNEGYIKRLVPIKVYIDSFIDLGGGDSNNVYVVTATINEVETLSPDSQAYVENVGTKKDLVLNIGIPQGVRGDKGEQGIQGIQGEKGDKGDKGDKGEKGEFAETDAVFSFESENPLQNKVITNMLYADAQINNYSDKDKEIVVNDLAAGTKLKSLEIRGKTLVQGDGYPYTFKYMGADVGIYRGNDAGVYSDDISAKYFNGIKLCSLEAYSNTIEADTDSEKLIYTERVNALVYKGEGGLSWSSMNSTAKKGMFFIEFMNSGLKNQFSAAERNYINNGGWVFQDGMYINNYAAMPADYYGVTGNSHIRVGEGSFRLWFDFDMNDNIFGITDHTDATGNVNILKNKFKNLPLVLMYLRADPFVEAKEITASDVNMPVANLFKAINTNTMSLKVQGNLYPEGELSSDADIMLSYPIDKLKKLKGDIDELRRQIEALKGDGR